LISFIVSILSNYLGKKFRFLNECAQFNLYEPDIAADKLPVIGVAIHSESKETIVKSFVPVKDI